MFVRKVGHGIPEIYRPFRVAGCDLEKLSSYCSSAPSLRNHGRGGADRKLQYGAGKHDDREREPCPETCALDKPVLRLWIHGSFA